MSVRALRLVRDLLSGRRGCGCDTCPMAIPTTMRKLALFGSPNVGKSMIFNQLTGSYAIVSNYPGTTVEIARGRARIGDIALQVIDTPGSYSLAPFSEDERVARDLLLDERPDLVLHVIDAKNLRRMLPLTFQLIEAGFPIVLDVNIIDEAERAGMGLDLHVLRNELGIPVIATAAASGIGIEPLRILVASSIPPISNFTISYPQPITSAMKRIMELLNHDYGIAPRAVALLLLQRDRGMWDRLQQEKSLVVQEVSETVAQTEAKFPQPLSYAITIARQEAADRIGKKAITEVSHPVRPSFTEVLGRLAIHPIVGVPILIAVLYFGLYQFVGKLAAGMVVDLLEGSFERYLNPVVTSVVTRALPWPAWSSLFVGEYGVITLGLRYAIALILPLVTAFFLMFALLEDSGYLPRLALLVDRIFKKIGLSGRAVIPIVLGLGCDTMATMVTRVLGTRRERIIATFLLALAIPCSAQLGVILGLLSGHPRGLVVWAGVVTLVFLLSGFLAARILPGEAARFYLEIPPLRWPSFRNVAAKTFARLRWYAAEVIPLFLLASVMIWIGQLTHLFQLAIYLLRFPVHAIGLPDSAADAFLFGFFRRDYGAARIFDTTSGGAISGVPLVVAMVTITLFIPCIAQFLVMQKERGIRTAIAVAAIILPFAFGMGYFLNLILSTVQVKI